MHSDKLIDHLKTLIAFRVVFVTLLLGSFLYFQIGRTYFPYPFSVLYLIVALYSISIAYLLMLNRVRPLLHGYIQMVVDTLTVIALIFMTGGIESWFSWLLLVVVMLSAFVVSRRAAFITATISSLLYGLIINWQFYDVIPLPYQSILEEKDFVYKSFSHIGGLYLIALLSGQLSARLKQSREDMEDLSKFNRDVIENTPSGIITTDLNGNILLFNRSAESILGIYRYVAKGTPLSDLMPNIDRAKETPRFEMTVDVGGKTKIIGLNVSDMLDATGTLMGQICTFQDLTELRTLSKEIKHKENLANIGELSAKIAHEIRNPLASLRSSIEMLKEDSNTSQQQKKRLMSIAVSEMDRLNNIITDFLKFSRPSPIKLSRVSLTPALDETTEMLMNRDPGSNIRFTKDLQKDLILDADMDKLRDVFWNLGINAIESMPHGGTLDITAVRHDNNVIITFMDTGTGIDSAIQEKVFFPFYTTKADGTGLGLSTAYRVIEDHGGSISLGDNPEGGTIITITLPGENE